MSFADTILKLTKQLYPTGRAFKMPLDGDLEKLHKALAVSEAQAHADALSILDSLLPDNSNFTAADATAWERRFGMIVDSGADLEDRKLAIARKLNHPGIVKARQHYLYIQAQLQAAGFDVYVHENRFDDTGTLVTKTPNEFSNTTYPSADSIQHSYLLQTGPTVQHGGGGYGNKVVNHVDESLDDPYNLGGSLKHTFFIGAEMAGDWASVPAVRKDEFRKLILTLKPAQTVAFLLVNFT